jgi:hypothetical protein
VHELQSASTKVVSKICSEADASGNYPTVPPASRYISSASEIEHGRHNGQYLASNGTSWTGSSIDWLRDDRIRPNTSAKMSWLGSVFLSFPRLHAVCKADAVEDCLSLLTIIIFQYFVSSSSISLRHPLEPILMTCLAPLHC